MRIAATVFNRSGETLSPAEAKQRLEPTKTILLACLKFAAQAARMKNSKTFLVIALTFALARVCAAQTTSSTASPTTATGNMAPYTEGPVWELTMVRTKPGMEDDYLKNLAHAYKSTSDEAKKQGIIMDYKIMIGDAANRDDYNVLLLVQFKNMAALDGLRQKTDPIAQKLIGGEEQIREGALKRMEIRDILGAKTMREITLK